RYAARRGPRVVHADHFAGPALQGRPGIATLLLRLIEQLPPGTTELMVHPGRVDAELRAVDSYVAPRERELDALLSREVRDRLRLGDVSLVSFAALARSS
ncbi:MAG: ChbG/HpnK family deacetylase, partial [Gemmatimonadaceae bacterium]|nr:ChbG/HpnK family deacetylase [Gemmatimonadaceae bacterium]